MSERTEETKQESSTDKSQISNNNTFSFADGKLIDGKLTVSGPAVENLVSYMAAYAKNGMLLIDSFTIDLEKGTMELEHNGKKVTVF